MTPEQERKAELTVVMFLHDKSREERRAFCKSHGIGWGEYQYLKRKYKRLTDRLDAQRLERNQPNVLQ